MKYITLDKEEQQILDDFDQGKLRSAPGAAAQKKRYVRSARETLSKTKNINSAKTFVFGQ